MKRSLHCWFDPAASGEAYGGRHAGLLAMVARTGAMWLHVFALTEDAVSLGRFMPPPPAGGVAWLPRFSGGRAAPVGPGYLCVALALPHRSALVGDDPLALAPEQVLNRCVRGVMAGFKAIGIELFYPGRDLLTVGSRACAMVTFTVEPGGGMLFEAVIAIDRDFSVLPLLLDRGDPAGLVQAQMWQAEQVAALGVGLSRRPSFAELAERIAMGYASTFGLTVVAVESPPPMAAAGPTCVPVPLALNRRGSVSTMLGVIDAHVAVSAEPRVLGARIAGDVIADPAGIAALEAGLVGCPAAASSVQAVVDRVYADPNHFLLGIGPTATLTDAIMRAVSG